MSAPAAGPPAVERPAALPDGEPPGRASRRPIGYEERGDDPGYGWAIVAVLGVTEAISYGVLSYAFSVLLLPMQRDLGWSQVALTGAYSLAILVSGLASIPVGRLLDRISPRLPMTAGSVLAALLVLAWSRVSTLPQLYLVFATLGVAMALVLYGPAFIVITKWFRFRRNAALTALTMIAAFSSFIFSPLTNGLVAAFGWRGAVVVLALILAVGTVPLHALALRPAPHQKDPSRPEAATPRTPRAAPRAEPHAQPRAEPRADGDRGSFWMIVVGFTLSSFTTTAIAVLLVPILIGAGSSAAVAALAAGLMGLSQIPGRLLFALAGRRLSVQARTRAVFVLAAVAMSLLIGGRSGWVVFVFVVCLGMSSGMLTLLRATLPGDLYGRANYGAVSGLVNAFTLAACATAPLGAALIALAPGGYTTLLLVLTSATCLAAFTAARGVARITEARRATYSNGRGERV